MGWSSARSAWRRKAGWWALVASGMVFVAAVAAASAHRADALRAEAAFQGLLRQPVLPHGDNNDGARQPTAVPDYTHELPRSREAARQVAQIQRLARVNGVILGGVNAQYADSSRNKLGRLELAVQLRGSYLGIKAVVGSVTAEHGVVLHRLILRRGNTPAELEAQADWTLLSRPATAEGT